MRSSNFSLPPMIRPPGDAHVVEDDLGGVRRADAVLLELLALAEALRARRDDERRLTAGAQVGIDRRHDDVHVGDAAVGGPRLGAVEDPLVGGLVVARAGDDRRDVGARAGLRRAERGELRSRRSCRTSAAATPRTARVSRWRRATRRPAPCRGSTARCRRRPRTAPRTPSACRGPSALRLAWRTDPPSRARSWRPPG